MRQIDLKPNDIVGSYLGGNGASLLLAFGSPFAVQRLIETIQLAIMADGASVKIPELIIGESSEPFTLELVKALRSGPKRLQSVNSNELIWFGTEEQWDSTRALLEGLLTGAGHTWLNDAIDDDFEIEASIGETHEI